MTKLIILVEKQIDVETVSLIAELNICDENNKILKQLSRSPFIFPNTMSDEEIIQELTNNQYKNYF